jgi:hypothetical protein
MGVLGTGLELGCVAELYLPIVAMVSEPRHRATATLYLLAYELAFVVPVGLIALLVPRTLGLLLGQRGARPSRLAWRLGLGALLGALATLAAHHAGWLD